MAPCIQHWRPPNARNTEQVKTQEVSHLWEAQQLPRVSWCRMGVKILTEGRPPLHAPKAGWKNTGGHNVNHTYQQGEQLISLTCLKIEKRASIISFTV